MSNKSILYFEIRRNLNVSKFTSNTSLGVILTDRFFGSVINEATKKGQVLVRGVQTKIVIEDIINPGVNAIQEQMSDIAYGYGFEEKAPHILVLGTPQTGIQLQSSMPEHVALYRPKQGQVLRMYDVIIREGGYSLSMIAGKFITS